MTPLRRAVAIAIVLLSQVASGFAVLCEEDSGAGLVEVFAGACCSDTEGGAPTTETEPGAPHDCGECSDQALTHLIPGHGDERELTLPPMPQERCAVLPPSAPRVACAPPQAGHDALPASTPSAAAQLLGAVVMHC